MTVLEFLAGFPLALALVAGGLWLGWSGWPRVLPVLSAVVLVSFGAVYGYALWYVETNPNFFK